MSPHRIAEDGFVVSRAIAINFNALTGAITSCAAAAALILAAAGSALSQGASNEVQAVLDPSEFSTKVNTVPLTLRDFPRAETHHMMAVSIKAFDFLGQWHHIRELTPIDKQTVVRSNRDTLYSGIVLDLTTPAVITKPDIGDRYQSLLILNEDHFARRVIYEPGDYELTRDEMGSRYVFIIVRTLVDAEDPDDLALAHTAQDGLQVSQADKGRFEVPNWDMDALGEMRDALKVLGKYLKKRDTAFGATIEDVDPLAYVVATADTWGGWKPENAAYQNFIPVKNDGETPYVLTLKDVPNAPNAFWSISVYNEAGFFEKNAFDKYVINSAKAEYNEDGSATIHFGGDPSQPNFLPIMREWNYMLRIYLPRKAYFDGSWTAPEASPVE